MKNEKFQKGDDIQLSSIMEMVFGFQKSRILFTAYELDIFTILDNKNKSSVEVAGEIGIDGRAADRLMNALCALGLLEKRESKFSNIPICSELFVKGKSGYAAGLMHMVHLWDSWNSLTEAVRSGKAIIEKPIPDRSDKWLEAFITAMHYRAFTIAPDIINMLDLSGISNILDVGGGSGVYAMAFARARNKIRATVFDLANVIPITKRYIKNEGFSDRVDTVTGDYNKDDLGSGFDLVFLSSIIHSNSIKNNISLIQKCSKALKKGGKIVIQDFIVDEDRTGPDFAVIFALNMLVGTESGDTYTESEVRSWLHEAGFANLLRKDTGYDTALIIGEKI